MWITATLYALGHNFCQVKDIDSEELITLNIDNSGIWHLLNRNIFFHEYTEYYISDGVLSAVILVNPNV